MDVLLTAVVGFTQLVLGAMGVYVSLRPPQEQHHWRWITGFIGVGLLGIGLTAWIAQRGANAEIEATNKISQAVTAATNANTSATNANDAAVAAGKETEQARAEARTANESLSKQINQRSTETNTAIVKLGTETTTSIKTISSGPPSRRIAAEVRPELIRFLSANPGKVGIGAISNDVEAYRFAQDWYEVLKAAGWTIIEDNISSFISTPPQQGVVLGYHGEPVAPNQMIEVPKTEPIGQIVSAMNALKVTCSVDRQLKMNEGVITLSVYSRPLTN